MNDTTSGAGGCAEAKKALQCHASENPGAFDGVLWLDGAQAATRGRTASNPNMRRLAHIVMIAAVGMAAADLRMVSASQITGSFRDQVMAAIAAAAGIPPLESAPLPPGYREIRMRAEQPNYCCDPRPMLRLVEGPGDTRGDLWLFRTLYFIGRPGNPQPRPDERCAPLGTGAMQAHICVRPWNLSFGDWTTVAMKLEQLGAWALVDPCSGFGVSDSGLLSVQRLVESTASSFSCAAPRFGRQGDLLTVKQLYEYFVGLGGPIPHEPVQVAP